VIKFIYGYLHQKEAVCPISMFFSNSYLIIYIEIYLFCFIDVKIISQEVNITSKKEEKIISM